MMTPFARRIAVLTLLFSCAGGRAPRAQYAYPAGYERYGWGGWGGGTGAGSTVGGSVAAGMGQYAAGAGQYNVQTAQARSVNAQTAMGLNQYMWECQQNNNKIYYQNLAGKKARLDKNWNAMRERVLNNPEESDIASGDTLNALKDLITSPKIYPKTLQLATQPLPGAAVRRIPFNYAAGGLTYSLSELTSRENVPAVFDDPAFAELRKSFRKTADQLLTEANTQGQPKQETVTKFRAGLDEGRKILEANTPPGSDQRLAGEKYIKALYGLSRMLMSPSYDVYLAAAGKQPSVPLSDVLVFMHAFNLRFGPAKTPEDRELYGQLYGALSTIRQALNPSDADLVAAANNGPQRDSRPQEFFAGMDYSHMAPPAARPGPAPPPPARP